MSERTRCVGEKGNQSLGKVLTRLRLWEESRREVRLANDEGRKSIEVVYNSLEPQGWRVVLSI